MARITVEQYHECYELGKKIIEGSMEIEDAVRCLYKSGMSDNSARMYLRSVRAMLTGERFTATIKEDALAYYLTQIYTEHGAEGLKRALHSVREYLEYQKDKNGLPGSRKIYEDFYEIL